MSRYHIIGIDIIVWRYNRLALRERSLYFFTHQNRPHQSSHSREEEEDVDDGDRIDAIDGISGAGKTTREGKRR
jgi:hypothetical protein